jgi:hypothetical protein
LIPKSFKETNTLYYGNESGEFFGAPIKLISTDYYLKYNIKLLCFNAKHDNEKYILPKNILTKKVSNSGQYGITSGILPFINSYNNNFIKNYSTDIRKDIIKINLLNDTRSLIFSNFNFNFFGNNLIYKKVKTNTKNEWSNLYDLYNIISDLCFADSGSLDVYEESPKEYYQYGYQLSGCEGCIDKITLITGNNNFYSGVITLYYNPRKIYKNYNNFYLSNTAEINNENFVTSNYIINSGNFEYIKYTGVAASYA